MPSITYSGASKPSDWQQVDGGRGIFVDVEIPSGIFRTSRPLPVYVASISGDNNHWATTGASSIYQATCTGFRVYVRWIDGSPLTPDFAQQRNWSINWIGIQHW